jgi:hypothetical protein
MRERFRTGVADTVLCLIVVALLVEFWVTRSSGSPSTVELAAFSSACGVALVVMLVARMAARHARATQAERDRVAAEAREAAFAAEVEARAEAVRAAHVAVKGAVNEIIVEIVAAQQAIVRTAYPDDILVRLHAAEDNAHGSLDVIEQAAGALDQSAGADAPDIAVPAQPSALVA